MGWKQQAASCGRTLVVAIRSRVCCEPRDSGPVAWVTGSPSAESQLTAPPALGKSKATRVASTPESRSIRDDVALLNKHSEIPSNRQLTKRVCAPFLSNTAATPGQDELGETYELAICDTN
jgi:hypothetical protein